MLEIAVLILLASKIGRIAEKKGRKKISYQLLLVGLWVGGEAVGAVIGIVLAPAADIYESGRLFLAVFALGGGIVGAVIAFQIAKRVPPPDADEIFRGIEYADDHGARERFHERGSLPPAAADAYTDNPERGRRPLDDRVQE